MTTYTPESLLQYKVYEEFVRQLLRRFRPAQTQRSRIKIIRHVSGYFYILYKQIVST
jgi:hypothetical protein